MLRDAKTTSTANRVRLLPLGGDTNLHRLLCRHDVAVSTELLVERCQANDETDLPSGDCHFVGQGGAGS